jgi:hypothetical protein
LKVVGSDVQVSGTSVEIPITVQVQGDVPMRVFMMKATVTPLDGSPAPTSIDFAEVEDLASGSSLGGAMSANTYAATWLSPAVPGVSGTNGIGSFLITFPSTVNEKSAYLLHFIHFSGSPNGLALFPVTTNDTLITFGDRTSSSLHDGIPDAWRLRYFGSLDNLLGAATADADGDGYSNLAEYLAGTNPLDAASKPVTELRLSGPDGAQLPNFSFQWPTVSGQQYLVEYADAITSTNWTILSSNLLGDGAMRAFTDATATNVVRFYRVRSQ